MEPPQRMGTTVDVPIFDDDHSLTTRTWFIELVIAMI